MPAWRAVGRMRLSPVLQMALVAFGGGVVLAEIASSRDGVDPVIAVVIGTALVGLVLWIIVWSLAKMRSAGDVKRDLEVFDEMEQSLIDLSFEAAKEKAEAVLNDANRFRCTREPLERAEREHIPAAVRDLFDKYSRIDAVYGDLRLERDRIGPSRADARHIRLGIDTDACEVVLRAEDGHIAALDGSEDELDEVQWYPSIYHYIVATDVILYSDLKRNS